MKNKTAYVKQGQYLVVLDNSGNRLVEVVVNRDKCRKQLDRELVMLYDIQQDQISNVSIFVDGKRIR